MSSCSSINVPVHLHFYLSKMNTTSSKYRYYYYIAKKNLSGSSCISSPQDKFFLYPKSTEIATQRLTGVQNVLNRRKVSRCTGARSDSSCMSQEGRILNKKHTVMKRVLTATMQMPRRFLHRCMFTRGKYVPVLFNIKHHKDFMPLIKTTSVSVFNTL